MKQSKSFDCKHQKSSIIKSKNKLVRFLLPLIGLISLIWMLVRIIPKPNRAQYPCMKVAAPFAGGFLTYVAGLAAVLFSFRKAKQYFHRSGFALATIFIFVGLFIGMSTILKTDHDFYAHSITSDSLFIPTDPPNSPVGTGRGIFPGRVVWDWDTSATSWNGKTGYWWNEANTNQKVVDSMLSRSLLALTGKTNDEDAWDALFKYFNKNHGKGETGYKTGEKIAIKINLNLVSGTNNPGNTSFPSPQVVLALLRQLVWKAGVKDSAITFYDSNRYVPDAIYTKCRNEFPGVHFMGWSRMNGREKYVRDTTIIHWSEKLTMEINGGNPAYLPTVVTQASYLINLASFKAHRYVGVTFCSKNHFGTISSSSPDGSPSTNAPHAAGLHSYVAVHDIVIPGSAEWSFKGRPMNTYNALVDLMGHRDLGQKTLLFMIDALYGVQSEQDNVSSDSKWFSEPFNDDWTSSLFLSQDNVAIESVGLDFFRTEQAINPNLTYTYGSVDNYLHEAAQADNPPSGTYYCPNGDGIRLQSLGVHEHWNNPENKQYTRNLDTGEGIELIKLQSTATSVQKESIPQEYSLSQNYPNPFNPITNIEYSIPSVGISLMKFVQVKVFDAVGKEVAVLVNKEQSPGIYEVQFNGSRFSSGVYYYRLQADKFTETKKLILLK
jgi:hypothetical protein